MLSSLNFQSSCSPAISLTRFGGTQQELKDIPEIQALYPGVSIATITGVSSERPLRYIQAVRAMYGKQVNLPQLVDCVLTHWDAILPADLPLLPQTRVLQPEKSRQVEKNPQEGCGRLSSRIVEMQMLQNRFEEQLAIAQKALDKLHQQSRKKFTFKKKITLQELNEAQKLVDQVQARVNNSVQSIKTLQSRLSALNTVVG